MKFDLLSRNSIVLLEELIKDQELSKLITNNTSKPLDMDDIKNTGSLVMKNVFPTPFDDNVPETQGTQLRVFFSNGELENKEILNTRVIFQIIIHKDLWLIQSKDKNGIYQKRIRPYDIMDRIIDVFEGKSVKTLGVLKFNQYTFYHINKDYAMYSIVAEMMTL